MAAAVANSRRLLGIASPGELSDWAQRYLPSWREQAWLALHTHPDKTFSAQAIATLRVLPRWRDRRPTSAHWCCRTRGTRPGGTPRRWPGSGTPYAVREIHRGRRARR